MAIEYDVLCLDCDHVHEQSHGMREKHAPCPKCKSANVTTSISNTIRFNKPLDSNWENANGGRGEYFSQLEMKSTHPDHGTPDCYFRSRKDALEACKRRGFTVISK